MKDAVGVPQQEGTPRNNIRYLTNRAGGTQAFLFTIFDVTACPFVEKAHWLAATSFIFIRIGARYRRIRKRPKGKPSPQLYAYKTEKLQELVQQEKDGLINLYYGDESHICTEGYVPYG